MMMLHKKEIMVLTDEHYRRHIRIDGVWTEVWKIKAIKEILLKVLGDSFMSIEPNIFRELMKKED